MKNEHPVQTYKLLGIGHSNAFKIGCMRNMVIAETNQQCCSQIPLVFSTLREISVQYIDRRLQRQFSVQKFNACFVQDRCKS
jgi:hypothetical protein